MSGITPQKKEQIKTLKDEARKRIKEDKAFYKLSNQEQIDFKIEETKNRIYNCETDLNGMFKNNFIIKSKLLSLKETLNKLENEKNTYNN